MTLNQKPSITGYQPHLHPPVHAIIHEGELATFWLEDGILYAVAKNTPRTLQRQKTNYELIRRITDNKKVCLLADTTLAGAQDKEVRDYSANEMPNVFKAMAVISASSFGRFLSYIFLGLKKQPIPIKLFATEAEAREWLETF